MPVELATIRDLMLPGLIEFKSSWSGMSQAWLIFDEASPIIMPKPAIIGVKAALVAGATAAIIKNPIVTRRFWMGWAGG